MRDEHTKTGKGVRANQYLYVNVLKKSFGFNES